jgi:hypothetical protein
LNSALNIECRYIFKKINLTSNVRDNGLENGIRFFRNLKTTVLDINHPDIHQKKSQKPHILTQLDEIYGLMRDLVKKFFLLFLTKGVPLPRKFTNFFFLQIWSNHEPIDRSRRAE